MRIRIKLLLMLAVLLLTACSQETPQPAATTIPTAAAPAAIIQPEATYTPTPLPPTPTPEPPAAARVNGTIITLEAFERELARYEAAQRSLGNDPAAEGSLYQVDVLNYLVEQLLIEQAAATQGIAIAEEVLDAELQRLINEKGQADFTTWLEANQYTLDEFRAVLHAQMITQAMMESVTQTVSDTAEQVHARHIVVATSETGEVVLEQLQSSVDFESLAESYSLDESTRLNGGDLGFFPRGLLLSKEVEDVAFSLEVGQISGLIESGFGFHVIQVLEKDPARPLTPELQQRLRSAAFDVWLEQLWETATVERNI